ncbi:MAG: HNH endonuclease, partial [Verrucomicrobiota bacterium]
LFFYKNDPLNKTAGCSSDGYVIIYVDNKSYRAHRLAWFYMTGVWPTDEIDHRDLDKLNNKWDNLRAATRSENAQNLPLNKHNKTGFTGVSWDKRSKKFKAVICKDGALHRLGSFSDPIDAHNAYVTAKAELHTFNPQLTKPQQASEFALAVSRGLNFNQPVEPRKLKARNVADHEDQQIFDETYISGSEIVERLNITRPTLMNARKTGKLPGFISVAEGAVFLWERAAIEPYLVDWEQKLAARRELKHAE